jgi:putative colanic acid biosynthesis glycosyltransferase
MNPMNSTSSSPSRLEGGLRTRSTLAGAATVEKPLVSVITVVRNGEKHIEKAIQSVIHQTYRNTEYILVDGLSTDSTLDIIRKYEDRIAYWVSERDSGIYDAMNKGVLLATGDWVYFLGADDFLLNPAVLEAVFSTSHHFAAFDLVVGTVYYTDGRRFGSNLSFPIIFRNTCHHQGAFYRRSLFKDFKYDPRLSIMADYELNLLLFLRHRRSTRVPNVISCCSPEGLSGRARWKGYGEEIRVRRKHLGVAQSLPFDALTGLRFLVKKVLRCMAI